MEYLDRKTGIGITLVVLMFFLAGCSYMAKHPVKTKPPKVGLQTESGKRLEKLPKPKNKVVAAVYNFRDKTGQYKMSAQGGGSWSTAVTQGAASILIQSMESSGWFIPIERSGLGNLLNERKIIRSSRAHYKKQSGSSSGLPPLMFAGVMLEGGIISYDHNVKTGGGGLRYFGAGASGEYRQDRVTVYLRAVSTKNGKVLESVNATKTVLSQKISAGVFRYVKFKRLLEAETGVTFNEPTQLAVKSAIDKALESLIIEGVFDDLWQLKDPEAINSDIIQSYVKGKEEQEKSDMFGFRQKPRPYSYTVRLKGGVNRYTGDYSPSVKRPRLNLGFAYQLSEKWSPYLGLGNSYLAAKPDFNRSFSYLNLGMRYRFTPRKVYTPFLAAEFGALVKTPTPYLQVVPRSFNNLYGHAGLSGGITYYLDDARRWGIEASLKYSHFFSDRIDGVVHGNYNDYNWQANLGVSFSF
jgi:curli production assembly/transport component CsgG